MQVEIVRHHRRAQHRHGRVEAPPVNAGNQAGQHPHGIRFRHEDLGAEAHRDHHDQPQYERFQIANPQFLQRQHEQRIERGDQDRRQQWNVEQQVQRDGRAQHFGQIAGDNGDLAQEPECDIHPARIGLAARLGQISAGDDAQLRSQRLQQDGHGVRHDQHPEQLVAEVRAAIQVRGPVARVHVPDADQIRGAGKRQHLPPIGDVVRPHRLMDFRQ